MTSQYTILVRNMSASSQSFYTFQEQADFQNPGTPVLTNSLGSRTLAPYSSFGAQLEFTFDTQIFAGATSTMAPPTTAVAGITTAASSDQAMIIQSQAAQPIGVTRSPSDTTTKNQTQLTIYPLGLSIPTNVPGIEVGFFGVQVPAFTPLPTPALYCGCASIDSTEKITLSSYVAPPPNNALYCKPYAVYYVKRGNYQAGTQIDYDTDKAARCDFTTGYSTIIATYNSDGTFSTEGVD